MVELALALLCVLVHRRRLSMYTSCEYKVEPSLAASAALSQGVLCTVHTQYIVLVQIAASVVCACIAVELRTSRPLHRAHSSLCSQTRLSLYGRGPALESKIIKYVNDQNSIYLYTCTQIFCGTQQIQNAATVLNDQHDFFRGYRTSSVAHHPRAHIRHPGWP